MSCTNKDAKIRSYIFLGIVAFLVLLSSSIFAQEATSLLPDYRHFPIMGSRLTIWVIAQLHLLFAAFVLGVPIFAVIVECIGVGTKDKRYDKLAKEFTKLLLLAFSTTATFGGILVFLLIGLYPKVFNYLVTIFSPTMYLYVFLFIGEGFSLYLYYYAWDALMNKKWLHITLGVLLNLFGTALMFIANIWLTFMMSPRGINLETGELISLWEAINNFTWTAINIHRLIANICLGGAVAAAYAAYRFLTAKTEDEKAHYDWMGYVGNLFAISALIPLPFAGYWLAREIYGYSAQMGTTLMGGQFSWLFIIQAILIGTLFIGANYYLWLGLDRIPGGQRYMKYIIYMETLIFVCVAIWMTPHTLVATLAEARKIGAAHHPLLGVFGVMSAKNTVVNLIILTTFFSFILYLRANKIGAIGSWAGEGKIALPLTLSIMAIAIALLSGINAYLGVAIIILTTSLGFLLYQRSNKVATRGSSEGEGKILFPITFSIISAAIASLYDVNLYFGIIIILATFSFSFILYQYASKLDVIIPWTKAGKIAQGVIFAIAAGVVIFYGIYGYYVPANVRIGFSVYQVLTVLSCMILVMVIDIFLFLKARTMEAVQWGKMPPRSQYILFLIAITFVLLMGLMGFARSGIRLAYHVEGLAIMADTSPEALTPTLGFATLVISIVTVIFFSLVSFIFWLGQLGEKPVIESVKPPELVIKPAMVGASSNPGHQNPHE